MLVLKKELFEQIVRHCIEAYPNEACGILAGREDRMERVYETANVDKSPSTYFMDASEQLKIMKEIRNLGFEMLGIYHSHVASKALPSAHDVELAFYPEASYAIVSLEDKNNPRIRSFKIKEGVVSEEEVKIE